MKFQLCSGGLFSILSLFNYARVQIDCNHRTRREKKRQRLAHCMPHIKCQHGREKYYCRDCSGGGLCSHDRFRHACMDCNQNCRCTIEGCSRFETLFAGPRALMIHMRTQHMGEPRALTKTKELELHRALQRAGVAFEYQYFIPFAGCGLQGGTKHAFLDFVIAKPWGFLVIECDEEQHSHYDPSCDPRRDFDTAAAIALGSGHKLRILRYNPDPYKVDGITRRTPKEERVRRLLEVLERPEPATQLERLFLFYNHCSRDTLPEIASNWSVEVRAVSGLA